MKQAHLTVTKEMTKTVVASRSQVHIWSRPWDTWNSGGIHPFTGGPSGMRIQDVHCVNQDSTPITVFLLFFMKVIQLLVTDTDKYYSQYSDHRNQPDKNVFGKQELSLISLVTLC
jgi:hypothetical protein